MDDTLAIFQNASECSLFLTELNSLHPSLSFTCEREHDYQLSFLDILTEKKQNKFVTSVYKKPTFTGQYTRWESFGPKKRNTNLVGTLVHRALEICFEEKLASELNTIRRILQKNSYPGDVINLGIKKKISGFRAPKREEPEKYPVYLKIPWIDNVSLKFEKQTKNAVNKCFVRFSLG